MITNAARKIRQLYFTTIERVSSSPDGISQTYLFVLKYLIRKNDAQIPSDIPITFPYTNVHIIIGCKHAARRMIAMNSILLFLNKSLVILASAKYAEARKSTFRT